MTIFNIEVSLNEKQANTAIRHFDDPKVKNMVADLQGTVRTFFDKLATEEKDEKEEKIIFLTPVGIIEIEDDKDGD